MNCLCCSKPIDASASEEELNNGWHRSCVRRFFGTRKLPEIDITEEKLLELARESVNQGLTVPGVQKKISLHLTAGVNPRLTLVNYPTGFILKPQTAEYENLPECEYLAMQMAEAAGIKTVPYALIRIHGQENNLAYITRRIDRIGNKNPAMLAMEDFCQLDGRLAQDKYHGSYERCAKIIQRYSNRPGIDLTDFYFRLLLSFVIGNSDLHLKNLSLIETDPGSQKYVLSPTYDFLPVNVVLPEDKDEFALTMCGKNRRIRRSDFIKFALSIGISEKVADALIGQCISQEKALLSLAERSLLPVKMKTIFINLISERMAVLKSV